MTKLRALLAGAVIAVLAFAGGLYAQQITSRSLTGSEVLIAAQGGPGGASLFVPIAQARNAQGVCTTALTSGTLSTITNVSCASLVSTAASVSLTVNLPATPWDGQIFEWVNGSGGAFTAGTAAITDGATAVNFGTIGALAVGASVEYRYVLSTNSWYRIR